MLGQYLFQTTSSSSSSSSSSIQATSPQSQSKRLNTIYAFFESYSLLSPEALLSRLSPTFTHKVLPSSLDMPLRDRSAFAGHAKGITSIFQSFAMVPQVVFEDPIKNVVVAHCKMVGELHGLGHWENECMIWCKMAQDGGSIVEMREFVDSARARLLKEKLMGMMEERRAEGLMHD
ncbi:hypothetical protein EJ08DRAFT_591406 [Tothia fuscella]|uniref:SnoaL-like domain-containing protein n=1 Tax=Tothia fuscella TaxID=1048955 RepID=A0A9P4TXR5_9PEZI|nr:hypothetical protein EJ08DRAFT_591406 [Tothia fuscella]